jgi:rhodanese-related sulfurtransferase
VSSERVPTRAMLRSLAILGAALGVLAPIAGSPYASRHGRIDVEQLARMVQREEDHVTAVELAQWIKDRRTGLRIVDVRTAPEFEAYHVPGAERIPIESLPAAGFRADETIVLYSEGGAHAAQAWVFLRALGYNRVYFLRGGLYEWLDQVMNPTIGPDASAATRVEFERVAALSRYFGGVPRVGAPSAADEEHIVPGSGRAVPVARQATAMAARVRRRGC